MRPDEPGYVIGVEPTTATLFENPLTRAQVQGFEHDAAPDNQIVALSESVLNPRHLTFENEICQGDLPRVIALLFSIALVRSALPILPERRGPEN